jgi:hypothetical protein
MEKPLVKAREPELPPLGTDHCASRGGLACVSSTLHNRREAEGRFYVAQIVPQRGWIRDDQGTTHDIAHIHCVPPW